VLVEHSLTHNCMQHNSEDLYCRCYIMLVEHSLTHNCRQHNSKHIIIKLALSSACSHLNRCSNHWTICPSKGTTGFEPVSPDQNCTCNSAQQQLQQLTGTI